MNFKRVLLIFIAVTLIVFAGLLNVYAAKEYENNNDEAHANKLKLSTMTYGKLTKHNDNEDYYYFVAPISGTIRIKLYEDTIDFPNSNYITAFIYNPKYIPDSIHEVMGVNYFPVELQRYNVTEGEKYYIHINGDGPGHVYASGSYHFRVDYDINDISIKKLVSYKRKIAVMYGAIWLPKDYYIQIQYVKNKDYKRTKWKKAKTKNYHKGWLSGSFANGQYIRFLSKKTKYHIRLRAVGKIKGKKYYYEWSEKGSIKTK